MCILVFGLTSLQVDWYVKSKSTRLVSLHHPSFEKNDTCSNVEK